MRLRSKDLDASFYEVIGRLACSDWSAAKQIVSEVERLVRTLDVPPDYVFYKSVYDLLKRHCQLAREFIREQYAANDSVTRKELWQTTVFRPLCAHRKKAIFRVRRLSIPPSSSYKTK
jgi:hypothetical protein